MSHIGVKRLFFVAALLCVAAVPSVAAGCPFVHAKRSSADGTLEQQFLAAHGRSASVEELAARTVPESDASGDVRGDASDQWEGQIPMASNTSDPLVVFNNLFHTVYSNVGVDVRPDPVILVENDYLVLRNSTSRVAVAFTPPLYHDLKMVCHMPLSVFIALEPQVLYTNSTVALSADTTARLTGLLRDMQAALPAINAQRFPAPGQLERQVRISSVTVDFVQAVLSDKVVSYKDAVSMARGLLPLIWENIKEAGAAQVQLLDKAFRELSAMLTPLQSDALRVVVSSSHMARPQNLISQYFSRRFNVDIFQSHKFVTLETISSEQTALALMDTHVTDYATGTAFFGDAFRMHEDVLCGAAKLALDKMFPATANSTIGCFNTSTPIQ